MLRKSLIAIGGAVLLAGSPAAAQSEAEMAQMAALSAMFEVEPLTPEQEARLPVARQIVEKVLPEGAMMEVMGSTFDSLLGPIMQMANEDAGGALAMALGHRPEELGLDEAQTTEVLGIIDPAWRERNAAISSLTQTMMADMMTRMEPMMRNVMGELYAIYFDEQELHDISAFFETESGLSFARQSYAMAGDPRIMAAMFEDPELLFGTFAQMPAQMEAAMADVPSGRAYDELSQADRSRLLELTGFTKEELEAAMSAAADMRTM